MKKIVRTAAVMVGLGVVHADPVNILFILADDLGITDVAAYAERFSGKTTDELFYETPNMDRLVERGVAFSQAYANQLCSPTRAAILTGQYPSRHGITTATPFMPTYYNQGLEPPEGFSPHDVLEHKDDIKEPQAWINGRTSTALDPSLNTLPKVLASHRSVYIGKWHLGGHGAQGFQPADHGFETLAWFDAGASHYFDNGDTGHYSWPQGWNQKKLPFDTMPQKEYTVGDAGAPPYAEYLTDDLTARAIHFLEDYAQDRKQGVDKRPFFLYFNHFAVHTPLQAPQETVRYFEKKTQRGTLGHDNATYAAMVKHLDDSVGNLLDALEATGLSDNTLVVLTSDNGGVEYTNPAATDNAPFKGGKACLHEGGVRVPLVYWQPGRFESAWCTSPVNCTDHLPTLAELSGNALPEDLDGISLVPLLQDPAASAPPRTFIWHYPFNVIVKHPDDGFPLTPHSGIRVGDYKLLWDWHGRLNLYNIEEDRFEQTDLAAQMPERRDQMLMQLQEWLSENVEPRYLPELRPNYDPNDDKRPVRFLDMSASVRTAE